MKYQIEMRRSFYEVSHPVIEPLRDWTRRPMEFGSRAEAQAEIALIMSEHYTPDNAEIGIPVYRVVRKRNSW